MAAEGGTKCVKYLVFFFNLLFFIFGIVLLGFGIYALVNVGSYATVSSVDYVNGPRLFIAIGSIIAIIAFFGCCGAWKENRCLLGIFFVLLLIILGLEIAAAVLGYKDRDKVESNTEDDLKKAMDKYPDENKKSIDEMQKELKCCGPTGPAYWTVSRKMKPPESCTCEDTKRKCTLGNYATGCAERLKEYIKNNMVVISALAITLLVIQLLGMIFALILICRLGRGTYA